MGKRVCPARVNAHLVAAQTGVVTDVGAEGNVAAAGVVAMVLAPSLAAFEPPAVSPPDAAAESCQNPAKETTVSAPAATLNAEFRCSERRRMS